MYGTNGFGLRTFQFTTGIGVTNATVRFKDITPGGGIGVDVAIDGVRLQPLSVTNIASLNLYAGISIEGPSLGNYRIDYSDYVSDVNSSNWIALTNITISKIPFLFVDTAQPATQNSSRFYRAVYLPQ